MVRHRMGEYSQLRFGGVKVGQPGSTGMHRGGDVAAAKLDASGVEMQAESGMCNGSNHARDVFCFLQEIAAICSWDGFKPEGNSRLFVDSLRAPAKSLFA